VEPVKHTLVLVSSQLALGDKPGLGLVDRQASLRVYWTAPLFQEALELEAFQEHASLTLGWPPSTVKNNGVICGRHVKEGCAKDFTKLSRRKNSHFRNKHEHAEG
jgi:hypothetical protein